MRYSCLNAASAVFRVSGSGLPASSPKPAAVPGRAAHSPGISDQAVVNRYDETGGAGAHGITSSSLWAGQFMYDGAGNMTKHPMSGVLQYNGFGLPTSVSGASWQLGFTYDADGVRVTKTVGETPDETTVYVGGLYERRQPGGGDRTRAAHVFYMGAGGKTVAQVVRTNEKLADPVSRQRLTYAYVDQQGSTEVTRTEPGATSEPAHEVRNHYDPFGNLLAASSAGFDPRVVPGGIDMTGRDDVTSGFTGHEADGEIGLVNMGGRIYDPRIGRFLSPDPFVQDALFSQSHNRYTYVVNNPLKFTDPSGYNRCGSQGHDVPDSQCDERVTASTAADGVSGGTYTWCGNDGDGGDGYVPCAKLSPAEQFSQYNGENDFVSVQEMNTERANQRADDLPVLDELRELYAIADSNAANAERDEMRAQQKREEEERIAALEPQTQSRVFISATAGYSSEGRVGYTAILGAVGGAIISAGETGGLATAAEVAGALALAPEIAIVGAVVAVGVTAYLAYKGADALVTWLTGKTTGPTRLQQGTRPDDLPAKGEPNSIQTKEKPGGGGQIREYGPDGQAKVDYDFGHDHGDGDPHAHDWDWTQERARQTGRPLKPGE